MNALREDFQRAIAQTQTGKAVGGNITGRDFSELKILIGDIKDYHAATKPYVWQFVFTEQSDIKSPYSFDSPCPLSFLFKLRILLGGHGTYVNMINPSLNKFVMGQKKPFTLQDIVSTIEEAFEKRKYKFSREFDKGIEWGVGKFDTTNALRITTVKTHLYLGFMNISVHDSFSAPKITFSSSIQREKIKAETVDPFIEKAFAFKQKVGLGVDRVSEREGTLTLVSADVPMHDGTIADYYSVVEKEWPNVPV